MSRPPVRRLGAALLALAAAACAAEPADSWQRADVSPDVTQAVELDCHQRSVAAIAAATHTADVERVHAEREQYFARCMRGSGFGRR